MAGTERAGPRGGCGLQRHLEIGSLGGGLWLGVGKGRGRAWEDAYKLGLGSGGDVGPSWSGSPGEGQASHGEE